MSSQSDLPPRPEPRAARYEDLDVWRGVACLLVVVFHSTFYVAEAIRGTPPSAATAAVDVAQMLWMGVPIFFVISGYCIAATADRTSRRGLSIEFFRRRIRRIFPPYLACVALTAMLVAGIESFVPGLMNDAVSPQPPPSAYGPIQWLGNLTLTEGWRPALFGPPHAEGRNPFFLGPAWTLAYEEQFYFVVGVSLALWSRRFFLVLLLVTLTNAAAMAARPALAYDAWGTCLEFAGWIQFSLGLGLYWVTNYGRRWLRVAYALGLAIGFAALLGAPAERLAAIGGAGGHLMAATAFALVALALKPHDGRLSGSRWLAPVHRCGVMCYSVYLVHWPVSKLVSRLAWDAGIRSVGATMLVTVPLAIAATVSVAAIFHRHVERRFLNPPRVGQPTSLSAFASTVRS